MYGCIWMYDMDVYGCIHIWHRFILSKTPMASICLLYLKINRKGLIFFSLSEAGDIPSPCQKKSSQKARRQDTLVALLRRKASFG